MISGIIKLLYLCIPAEEGRLLKQSFSYHETTCNIKLSSIQEKGNSSTIGNTLSKKKNLLIYGEMHTGQKLLQRLYIDIEQTILT